MYCDWLVKWETRSEDHLAKTAQKSPPEDYEKTNLQLQETQSEEHHFNKYYMKRT